MENKNTNASAGMGGTLIITVFVVLCLMIFAALSFTTAYSDLKLARKAQDMASDYYSIHGKAEEKLSEISDILFETDINETMEGIKGRLSGIDGVSFDDKETVLQYEVHGDKNHKISVTLNILHDSMGYYYEISSWNLSNINMPDYEDKIIDIWKGTE
jgi:hypothetical protein